MSFLAYVMRLREIVAHTIMKAGAKEHEIGSHPSLLGTRIR